MKRPKLKPFAVRLVNIRYHTEDRLLLCKALTALKMATPVNERAAQQIKIARQEIAAALVKRAA